MSDSCKLSDMITLQCSDSPTTFVVAYYAYQQILMPSKFDIVFIKQANVGKTDEETCVLELRAKPLDGGGYANLKSFLERFTRAFSRVNEFNNLREGKVLTNIKLFINQYLKHDEFIQKHLVAEREAGRQASFRPASALALFSGAGARGAADLMACDDSSSDSGPG